MHDEPEHAEAMLEPTVVIAGGGLTGLVLAGDGSLAGGR
jgi:hypothetical protein